jgi:hypothetical protein
MTASNINHKAAAVLLTHREALAPSNPIMNIESPHQNAVKAYSGNQIKLNIPSMASPPTTIKSILPIKAIAEPMFDPEDLVEESDNPYHLQKIEISLAFSKNMS